MRSVQNKIDRLQQDIGAIAENCEMFLGLRGEEPHPFLCLFYAEKCNEIRLSSLSIGTQRLTDIGFVSGRVEQIIGNLIGQPKIVREAV